MKSTRIAFLPVLAAASLLMGCGEDSQTTSAPPPPAQPLSKAVDSAATSVGSAANETAKAADATKDKLQDVTKSAQDAAASTSAASQQMFNDLVAQVKKLIADGKGTEALQKLQSSFANLKLTPDQQKIIEDLTKQAQDALAKTGANGAGKAAGDLVKPKP